jgi:hypothetical protein
VSISADKRHHAGDLLLLTAQSDLNNQKNDIDGFRSWSKRPAASAEKVKSEFGPKDMHNSIKIAAILRLPEVETHRFYSIGISVKSLGSFGGQFPAVCETMCVKAKPPGSLQLLGDRRDRRDISEPKDTFQRSLCTTEVE